MVELAEEVEGKTRLNSFVEKARYYYDKQHEEDYRDEYFSREDVEFFLEEQRKLSTEKACLGRKNDNTYQSWYEKSINELGYSIVIDKDSILNAKYKF